VVVQVRNQGFAGEIDVTLRPDEGGYVETAGRAKGVFGPLAFVYVDAQGAPLKNAQVPVAMVSDGLVVVPLSSAAEGSSLFAVRLRTFRSNLYESLLVQSRSLQEIKDFQGERTALIGRAQAVLERSEADHDRLKGERDRLLADAREDRLPGFEMLTLEEEKKALGQLEEGVARLTRLIDQELKIDKEEKDPERKKALQQVEQAKLLEQEGDIDEALAIYEKAKGVLKSDTLDKHLAELKEQWKPKNDKHVQARFFIYKTWPDLDLAGLEQRFDDARAAFAVCKAPEVNDHHAARKLLKATEGHANKMLKRLGDLRPDINVEDEEPAKRIKELAPKLVKLGEEIQAYLDTVRK
jgi:hypothetical protein